MSATKIQTSEKAGNPQPHSRQYESMAGEAPLMANRVAYVRGRAGPTPQDPPCLQSHNTMVIV